MSIFTLIIYTYKTKVETGTSGHHIHSMSNGPINRNVQGKTVRPIGQLINFLEAFNNTWSAWRMPLTILDVHLSFRIINTTNMHEKGL